MSYSYQKKCSLLVSSCDKYSSAWYPYFALLKKFWVHPPEKIYLISEKKNYTQLDLPVTTISLGNGLTWSEMLYRALDRIDTEFIFFSLEDFFLAGAVNENVLEQCLQHMENDSQIAEIRIKPSSLSCLRDGEPWEEFRLANRDTPYRVDTQFALWRRTDLMSLIDGQETAWEFERKATMRAKACDKKFLWRYAEDPYTLDGMAFPYHLDADRKFASGYSIAWGKWLWNNRKLFEDNGIYGVNFKELGILSERAAERRRKYVFTEQKGLKKAIGKGIQYYDLADRTVREVRSNGGAGVKVLLQKTKRHLFRKKLRG